MGPAAQSNNIGIADNDLDQRHRDMQQIRDHLGKTGFMALPAGLGANHHIDAAFWLDRDLCAFFWGAGG